MTSIIHSIDRVDGCEKIWKLFEYKPISKDGGRTYLLLFTYALQAMAAYVDIIQLLSLGNGSFVTNTNAKII